MQGVEAISICFTAKCINVTTAITDCTGQSAVERSSGSLSHRLMRLLSKSAAEVRPSSPERFLKLRESP